MNISNILEREKKNMVIVIYVIIYFNQKIEFFII